MRNSNSINCGLSDFVENRSKRVHWSIKRPKPMHIDTSIKGVISRSVVTGSPLMTWASLKLQSKNAGGSNARDGNQKQSTPARIDVPQATTSTAYRMCREGSAIGISG